MRLNKLKQLLEARDQNNNRLFKYCTFEWIIDLLKDGKIYSYSCDINKKCSEGNDHTQWIALSTKRSSLINQYLNEYGPCEVTFDRELIKSNSQNEIFNIKFSASWLDKRPSITKFITKNKYSSSSDYFKKHYTNIDWKNTDNYSLKFFNEYLNFNKTLNLLKLLENHDVDSIEDYIYDSNYTTFGDYIRNIGEDDELVLIKSPLQLVNDAVLNITIPRRYKDKMSKYSFENEYKIRYD